MSWDAWKKKLRRYSDGAMNAGGTQRNEATARACPHPNDVDRRRIERALATRERYRYVSPSVRTVTGGYHIESPCCSRIVDRAGGVVDIALLQYLPESRAWQLYRKDHEARQWKLYHTYGRLEALLERLNTDPERIFWR